MPRTDTSTDRQRPGRYLAVVTRIDTRTRGFIFARGEDNEEYFLHVSGVPAELWPALQPGDPITCQVSDTSKGIRGFKVLRATEAEAQHITDTVEDRRGNI